MGSTRSITQVGDLTSALMYPTILTWAGAANVYFTGVEDQNTSGDPHLILFTQDRDAVGTQGPNSDESVTDPAAADIQEQKAYLARSLFMSEEFLCWTQKDPDDDSISDVTSKVKDDPDWLDSTERVVANAAPEEDHCMMDFWEDQRVTVAHRDGVGIGMLIDRWDGTTFTTLTSIFTLTAIDVDFPTIFIRLPTAQLPDPTVHVTGTNSANVYYYFCTGEPSPDCAAGQGTFTYPPVGGSITAGTINDPRVFAIPRGAVEDVFIVAERTDTDEVHLYSNCGNAGTWVDEGTLPLPAGISYTGVTVQQYLGRGPSASTFEVDVTLNGDEFDVPFLATNAEDGDLDPDLYDVLWFHGDQDSFCP